MRGCIDMVIQSIADDPTLQALCRRLSEDGRGRGGFVSGLWGSSARLVTATAAAASQRTFLYVTAHLEEADNALDDLELFGSHQGHVLPAWEALPGEGPTAGEIHAERVRLCSLLVGDPTEPLVIVAPIQALMQPVPTTAALEANTLRLAQDQRRDLTDLAAWLTDHGFERLERVESPGDFAVRGDILDIFAPGRSDPLRVALFDDRIDSIRCFDVSTHRSRETLASASVHAPPDRQRTQPEETTSFLTYLPADAVIVLDEPGEIQELGQMLHSRVSCPEALEAVADVFVRAAQFDRLHLSRFGGGSAGDSADCFEFQVTSLTRFEGKTTEAVAELCAAAADHEIHVFCDNEAERQRLVEILVEQAGQVPASVHMPIGLLHRGFEWVPARTICVGHHEVFHRYHLRRRIRRMHAARPIESWLDLELDDLVVHVVHGIARYRGIKTIEQTDTLEVKEFLTLEFDGQAVLHVPVSQVDLVQKYIGAGAVSPQLSTLGGNRWRKTTERVADSVSELAVSLLEVQAARETNEGIAYPADTAWQREFEAAFLYEETEDQLSVAEEIKADLQRARPMDRLLCGDVGYGKTELAIRAAFKTVEYGKQVAVLVPTTVLAEQHYQTFRERLADYPFLIGCLSRFRKPATQRRLIEDAKKGRVDILIGTHRLLSKDVGFCRPGPVGH